jgi:hypothetical protein
MNEPYFEKLAGYTRSLLDQLPIEREVQPLDYAINKLWQAFKERQKRETGKIRTLWCSTPSKARELPLFTGLNTAGMLADRFTILLIK